MQLAHDLFCVYLHQCHSHIILLHNVSTNHKELDMAIIVAQIDHGIHGCNKLGYTTAKTEI